MSTRATTGRRIGEQEQRIYGDLFPDARPIFVLGAARSGTTIVCDALRFGAGIPGCHEGFLFSTAYLLLAQLESYWQRIGPPLEHFARENADDERRRRALSFFDIDVLKRDVLRHFHDLTAGFADGRFVDKTPDIYMLHAAPMLSAAYPRAKFLFVRRNGLRVVLSRRRTHPEQSLRQSCEDWAKIMGDWQAVKPGLQGRHLEVDQTDVAMRPNRTARQISGFLGLGEREAEAVGDYFERYEPGKTTTLRPDEPVGLADLSWSERDKATFVGVCGGWMERYGYRF